MKSNREQAIKVLKAWHLVEFFQTFSVPSKEDSKINPVNISYQELNDPKANELLPWITPEIKTHLGLNCSKKITYTLYLGLFYKAALSNLSSQYFTEMERVSFDEIETEQRLDKEGVSCFAKIKLDEFGSPRFDTFSISTLPWAMGELLKGRAGEISIDKFNARCEDLIEYLDQWGSKLPKHNDHSDKKFTDTDAIMELVRHLYEWSGLNTKDLKLNNESTVNIFQMSFFESSPNQKKIYEDKIKQEKAGDEDEETSMPILNSFYIRDIEKAIKSIGNQTVGNALLSYLGNVSTGDRHTDLYTNKALNLLQHNLKPANTPEGRWPSEPKYNMTLMQQFSINTIFSEVADSGIISVNGPPGTGKTTLLRDVIAQNLVKRAKVLSSLSSAGKGITSEGYLIPELTGFEMVVASSNNAAVENISKELPQLDSIADCYSECRYFQAVANQICADEKNGRLLPIIDPKKRSWGLISAVMGAKAKRDTFLSRFFKYDHYKDLPPEIRPIEEDFLNIWQYKKTYNGLSFVAANERFNQALQNFERFNQKIIEFEKLRSSFNPNYYLEKLDRLQNITKCLNEKCSVLDHQVDGLKVSILRCREQENILGIEQQRKKLNPPRFFARFFNTKSNKQFNENLKGVLYKLESTLIQRIAYEKELSSFEKEIVIKQREQYDFLQEAKNIEMKFSNEKAKLEKLEKLFEAHNAPESSDKIDNANRQRNAYWQETEVNDLRSKVFSTAMELHEAWLIEAMGVDAFRKKIFDITDVVLGKKHDQASAIWQMLFMFVPVISTTFASLGRMFEQLSENSLGWLMIDEAGQAIPQSAIGGLMRMRRTVVVGDPLQVEPVFTSPPDLIDDLMRSILGTKKDDWSPCKWSVQQIADRVNLYGCELEVMGENKWIGIPLWVHRRCIDPMFSIANSIAYNKRMIHALSDNDNVLIETHPTLGNNRWIESRGTCSKKQYKEELGKDVLELLLNITKSDRNSFESIYIISPFKSVKDELKQELKSQLDKLSSDLGFNKTTIKNFLNKNIGTVHTFQGKENDTVILVLGCDSENNGGASWAASSPNLLNVAVTRAKKYLFIIGDSSVWSNKDYFSEAYKLLSSNENENENENENALVDVDICKEVELN